jgi:osmotically-inducible protein OsmY
MFTLLRLIFFPAKVGVGTAKVGMKTGYRAGRMVGYRRLFFLGAGIAIGLLIAPMTGRELRERLQTLINGDTGRGDLAERVRYELSHSPRTWHLPQPEVAVVDGRVVLRGTVPHATGKADLERIAAAVAGAADVDNQLAIAGAGTNGAL